MKKFSLIASLFILISSLGLYSGCKKHDSSDIPNGAPISASTLIGSGWNAYRSGNFAAALNDFSDAAARDATSLEAYMGIGWASIQQNQLDQARGNFNNVISLAQLPDLHLTPEMVETLTVEALVGTAQVDFASGNYQSTWTQATEVLRRSPQFQFRHDATINWRRVTILQAEAAIGLNKFSTAFAIVTKLDSSLFNNTTILTHTTRSLPATLLGSQTTLQGRIRFDIPDPALALVLSVSDTTRLVNGVPVPLTLDSLVEGGTALYARANPTPTEGSQYVVKYLRTDSYSTFLGNLRALIRTLRG